MALIEFRIYLCLLIIQILMWDTKMGSQFSESPALDVYSANKVFVFFNFRIHFWLEWLQTLYGYFFYGLIEISDLSEKFFTPEQIQICTVCADQY